MSTKQIQIDNLIEAHTALTAENKRLRDENAETVRCLRNIVECASPYDQEGPLDKVLAGHCVITYTVDGTWIDKARDLLARIKGK